MYELHVICIAQELQDKINKLEKEIEELKTNGTFPTFVTDKRMLLAVYSDRQNDIGMNCKRMCMICTWISLACTLMPHLHLEVRMALCIACIVFFNVFLTCVAVAVPP